MGVESHQRVVTSVSGPHLGVAPHRNESNWARAWRRFRGNKLALAALVISVLLVLVSVGAPAIARFVTHVGPDDQRLLNNFQGSSATHLLGTDEYGRDVLTRIAYGGRVSLGVALLGTSVAVVIGTLVGVVSAYYGGWIDTILMRFVDVMLAIPGIFLLILLGSMVQLSPATLGVVLALLSWFGLARLVRAEVLSVQQRDYIAAARVTGASNWTIATRHILPNVVHIIIVAATLFVPSFMLAEAALSFLGFGVQPPTPSWGNMLTNATHYFYSSTSLVFIPGLFITLTVIALSIVGDALRDALDPRLN